MFQHSSADVSDWGVLVMKNKVTTHVALSTWVDRAVPGLTLFPVLLGDSFHYQARLDENQEIVNGEDCYPTLRVLYRGRRDYMLTQLRFPKPAYTEPDRGNFPQQGQILALEIDNEEVIPIL